MAVSHKIFEILQKYKEVNLPDLQFIGKPDVISG